MKWLTPAAYREWRDVGLGGYTEDGRPWLGRNDQRNLAFAETMWSSGLRLREAGTLLLQELPASGLYPQARVADEVAKGSGRDFWISGEALQAIDDYRMSSRAAAVRRAQAAGRYDNVPGIMIASSITANRQLIYENEHGNEQMVSLDSLTAGQRRKVFVAGDGGLEPAMVWLSEGGTPLPYRTWQKVFQVANARCAAEDVEYRCYPHMLRHSFALRWLVVFMYAHEVRFGLCAHRSQGDPVIGWMVIHPGAAPSMFGGGGRERWGRGCFEWMKSMYSGTRCWSRARAGAGWRARWVSAATRCGAT